MRRTFFLALLAALVCAAPAHAAGTIQIIRDCADDGILQGNYTAAELRKAASHLPTDVDEYSDCRDVLSRAIAAKTSSGGPSGGTGGATAPAPPVGVPATPKGKDPGTRIGPSTPQDWHAVEGAITRGDEPVAVNGQPLSPGESRLAAHFGRNGLPGTMIAVLALLAAALAAMGLPAARRRVRARREP